MSDFSVFYRRVCGFILTKCALFCIAEASEAAGSVATCPRLLPSEGGILQKMGKVIALFWRSVDLVCMFIISLFRV